MAGFSLYKFACTGAISKASLLAEVLPEHLYNFHDQLVGRKQAMYLYNFHDEHVGRKQAPYLYDFHDQLVSQKQAIYLYNFHDKHVDRKQATYLYDFHDQPVGRFPGPMHAGSRPGVGAAHEDHSVAHVCCLVLGSLDDVDFRLGLVLWTI